MKGRRRDGVEGRAGLLWDPLDTDTQPFVVSQTVCFQIATAFSKHYACTVGSHTTQYVQGKQRSLYL